MDIKAKVLKLVVKLVVQHCPPAAMQKHTRSVSCQAMSFACRVWLAQTPNRYQPKRSCSSPSLAIHDAEMVEAMQVGQPPVHFRTFTFGNRPVSMEDVGQWEDANVCLMGDVFSISPLT